MGFNYRHTCPIIDREIDGAKSVIEAHLEDYIQQLCPLMSIETVYDLRTQWTRELYGDLESMFETVRETNQDMRNESEKQIGALEDDISELKAEIDKLELEINNESH